MNILNLFSSKQSIRREQFFDHVAYDHIKYYLSFYPDPFPDSSTSFVNEYYPTSRQHIYEEEKSWEESNGPQTYKGGIKEFVVEDGIRKIGARAFGYNLNLYSIKFPSTLERIGSEAFVGYKKLTHIELPENIKSIGVQAFTYSLEILIIRTKNLQRFQILESVMIVRYSFLQNQRIYTNHQEDGENTQNRYS